MASNMLSLIDAYSTLTAPAVGGHVDALQLHDAARHFPGHGAVRLPAEQQRAGHGDRGTRRGFIYLAFHELSEENASRESGAAEKLALFSTGMASMAVLAAWA
ncbi:unnamed protein product [Phytophthora fragariaefolia]|uniref:Unnamed protein product n=1 Tax=Phytophthora fragariaefolia TaxID=1490495 RepID=A0A9W6XYU5_9STRA|nr:unnamed protein product [Phytophthora fragariaefolia]